MRAFPLALALASLAALARPASACAPAPREGVRVQIAEESAIIAWNAADHTEHFVRRAAFHGGGQDFGFLVPTPGKPDLGEVGDEVFDRLEQATKPKIVHDDSIEGIEPTAICAFPFFLMRGAAKYEAASVAPDPVRVLGAQRVAGYDAVILEADDPKALADWLKQHGYASRPELRAWLTPYVDAKWKLTAFKIAGGAPAVATAAVRMSFAAERPFFPYREPADQRENLPADVPRERLLRVFFIGTERVDGAVGSAKLAWPGKTIWSDRLDAAPGVGPLPISLPAGAWLTMFEDHAAPRPGTDDLFFAPAADKKPVKPPPIVISSHRRIPLPLDLIGGGALIFGLWLRRRRRLAEIKREPAPK
jgi:hypothetical protein